MLQGLAKSRSPKRVEALLVKVTSVLLKERAAVSPTVQFPGVLAFQSTTR